MLKKLMLCGGLLVLAAGGVGAADRKADPVAPLSVAEVAQLEKSGGVHPRLFLTARLRDELRGAIKTTHSNLWTILRTQADQLVRHGPPKYRLADTQSGD